jgi:hypothetical protein
VNGTVKMVTKCPDFHEASWKTSRKSSEANPCTNVPIVCELCYPNTVKSKPVPAIWKYNARTHFQYVHLGYRVPGWPALEGIHDARASEGDWPLPSLHHAELLNYADGEERRIGVAQSGERWCTTEVQSVAKRLSPSLEEDEDEAARTSKRPKSAQS